MLFFSPYAAMQFVLERTYKDGPSHTCKSQITVGKIRPSFLSCSSDFQMVGEDKIQFCLGHCVEVSLETFLNSTVQALLRSAPNQKLISNFIITISTSTQKLIMNQSQLPRTDNSMINPMPLLNGNNLSGNILISCQ